jgi:hypothetical protein
MICSSCGAEIADKAIVCYRCGTPTAIPAPPVRPASPRPRTHWPTLLIVAISGWVVFVTPPDSGARYAAYAALAVALLAVLRIVLRR